MKRPPNLGTVNDGWIRFQYNWGAPFYSSTNTRLIETGTFTSVRTPNFKVLRQTMAPLPFNPFTYSYALETRTVGSYSTPDGRLQQDGYVYGQVGGTVIEQLLSAPVADTDAIAKSKLLSKIGEQSVNLAQAYAERHQTIGMIAKSINRLASAAIAIRRGNLAHASKLFESIEHSSVNIGKALGRKTKNFPDFIGHHRNNLSNYWLEYSYGWRPLLSDIHGSMELLANTYYRRRPYSMSSQHQINLVKHDYTHKRATSGNYNANKFDERADSVAFARTRYLIEYCEDNAFTARMAQTGLSNPIDLAWELIPYSFVVDWVLPVGQYLQNMQAANGLFFQRGTKSVSTGASHSTRWVTIAYPDPINGQQPVGGGRTLTFQSKTRSVLADFPSPSLPSPQWPSQVTQALSGIALLTQAFRR